MNKLEERLKEFGEDKTVQRILDFERQDYGYLRPGKLGTLNIPERVITPSGRTLDFKELNGSQFNDQERESALTYLRLIHTVDPTYIGLARYETGLEELEPHEIEYYHKKY